MVRPSGETSSEIQVVRVDVDAASGDELEISFARDASEASRVLRDEGTDAEDDGEGDECEAAKHGRNG